MTSDPHSVLLLLLHVYAALGATVIPRSTSTDHLKENLAVFSWHLEEDEMAALGWRGVDPGVEETEL